MYFAKYEIVLGTTISTIKVAKFLCTHVQV